MPSFKLNILQSKLSTPLDCFLRDFLLKALRFTWAPKSLTEGLSKHHFLFSTPHSSLSTRPWNVSRSLSFTSLAATTTCGTHRHFPSCPLSPGSLPAHYLQDSLKHNQMKPLASFKTPMSPSRTHSLLPITTSLQFNPRRPLPSRHYKIIILNVLCCFTHSAFAHTFLVMMASLPTLPLQKGPVLLFNSQFKCFLLLSSAEIMASCSVILHVFCSLG